MPKPEDRNQISGITRRRTIVKLDSFALLSYPKLHCFDNLSPDVRQVCKRRRNRYRYDYGYINNHERAQGTHVLLV